MHSIPKNESRQNDLSQYTYNQIKIPNDEKNNICLFIDNDLRELNNQLFEVFFKNKRS
jgi:hypothetical protein